MNTAEHHRIASEQRSYHAGQKRDKLKRHVAEALERNTDLVKCGCGELLTAATEYQVAHSDGTLERGLCQKCFDLKMASSKQETLSQQSAKIFNQVLEEAKSITAWLTCDEPGCKAKSCIATGKTALALPEETRKACADKLGWFYDTTTKTTKCPKHKTK